MPNILQQQQEKKKKLCENINKVQLSLKVCHLFVFGFFLVSFFAPSIFSQILENRASEHLNLKKIFVVVPLFVYLYFIFFI